MRIRRLASGEVVRDAGESLSRLPVVSVAELLHLRRDELRTLLDADLPAIEDGPSAPPIDGRTEIWASGVTYLRSRTARMGEATDPDIYDRVYSAERPELFFKSAAWRAVTDGDLIGIREDSGWNVPEPELAVIANAFGEIVGYAVCDDVSSRSIEGENPLYLPQAKVYAGSCAVSAAIRPAWEVDVTDLDIRLRISRGGEEVFSGATRTDQLARTPDDLVSHLFRAETFPDGAWLSTGTGIVPPDAFSLEDGDVVDIAIDEVGALRNTARRGRDHWAPRSIA
jgi:2-dehydro-3-deoxy-D-arabinonate dehydratase